MKKVPVQDISGEELAALNEWASKMRAAQPQLVEVASRAKAAHKAMIEAPTWSVVETEQQPGSRVELPKDPWSIGAPKVNYVDHIEGDPFESPESGKEFE